ncbi:MAG: AarF/UbiB family protein [bacterium]|nr:AarF/UbiB family protein [bacterium]
MGMEGIKINVAEANIQDHEQTGVQEKKTTEAPVEDSGIKIEKELRSGLLPEALRESWKIVDPESQEAKIFQEEAEKIAIALYTPVPGEEHLPYYEYRHHDFQNNPVRFLLSKDESPNAWFVDKSDPPIIVLSQALFTKKDENGEAYIESPDDLAAIIGHELTHMKMREVYGAISNSKAEEGFAYSMPLVLMRDHGKSIGLNPENVFRKKGGGVGVYERLCREQKKNFDWNSYFDVHPAPDNIHSIVSDTLAYLKKERGTLEPDVPAVKPYGRDSRIIQSVTRAEFHSFVESRLEKFPGYGEADLLQKAEILDSILGEMGSNKYDVRVGDVVSEIRRLRPQVKTAEDKRIISRFADRVLKIGEGGDIKSMKRLYGALCSTVNQKFEKTPLGRFRTISREIREFINATNDGSNADMLATARKFVGLLEDSNGNTIEPFLDSPYGRSFLAELAWPQFAFPSEEKIARARRRGEGVQVEWDSLRKIAGEKEEVAKACAYLGLIRDPFILAGAMKHEELALRIIGSRLGAKRQFGSIAEISSGPNDGHNKLNSIRFDADGLAIGIRSESSDSLMDKYVTKALEEWIEGEFIRSSDDPEAQQEFMDKLSAVEMMVSKKQLIGLDSMEKNFPLFLRVNEALWQERTAINFFLKRLNDLGQNGTILAREFFMSEVGERVIQQSFGSFPVVGYSTKNEMEMDEKGEYLNANPYLVFISKSDSIFSATEKYELFNKYIFTNRTGVEGTEYENFLVVCSELDDEKAKYFCDFIRPVLAENGFVDDVGSWGGLIKKMGQMGKDDAFGLEQAYLYNKSFGWLQDKNCPTVRQAADFLSMVPSEYIKNSTFQISLQEQLQERSGRFASKEMSKMNLDSAISLWYTLSRAEVIYPDVADAMLASLIGRIEALGSQDEVRKMSLAGKLMEGGHIQDPQMRKQLIGVWTESVRELNGLDENERGYVDSITMLADNLKTNKLDRAEILQTLASTLQAQDVLCRKLRSRAYEVTGESLTSTINYQIFTDAGINMIKKSTANRTATLDFLIAPLTKQSVDAYVDRCAYSLEFTGLSSAGSGGAFSISSTLEEDQGQKEYREQLAKSSLRKFYENFWAAPIDGRAILARELLISPDESLDTVDAETFDYAVSKVFSGEDKNEKEARIFLRSYIDALPKYQQHLCLGAIMSAAERRGKGEVRMGEALAYFLENMGPAETKFGQAAQSHPQVPEDIRTDLRRLKFRAGEPMRWDITQWVEETRDDLEQNYLNETGNAATITHIGDMIGSGSINVVVDLDMSDGNSYVLSLLRPNVEAKGHSGFETMRRMADNLSVQNDSRDAVQTVRELIDQANDRLVIEVDCGLAKQQYSNAKQLYAGTSVVMDGEKFEFDSADVVVAGKKYFMMQKMQGQHYIELPETTDVERQAKKKIAQAILTVELNNKLRGKFDPDRHGGNVRVSEDLHKISHFDFKSMAVNEWADEGLKEFANLLIGALTEEKTAEEFFNDLVDQERVIREEYAASGRSLDPFVAEVSKGLLTDGEYAQMLDKEDLMRVVVSALLAGIHPVLKESLLDAVEDRIPEPFKGVYFERIRPELETALETGELTQNLSDFLPYRGGNDALIKINRSFP